jgi:hypothetical protein
VAVGEVAAVEAVEAAEAAVDLEWVWVLVWG